MPPDVVHVCSSVFFGSVQRRCLSSSKREGKKTSCPWDSWAERGSLIRNALIFIFTRCLAVISMWNLASERTLVYSLAFAALFDTWPRLYISLSNLRGSKVPVVNRLGWLMQIQSLCARSRSAKMACIRLLALHAGLLFTSGFLCKYVCVFRYKNFHAPFIAFAPSFLNYASEVWCSYTARGFLIFTYSLRNPPSNLWQPCASFRIRHLGNAFSGVHTKEWTRVLDSAGLWASRFLTR